MSTYHAEKLDQLLLKVPTSAVTRKFAFFFLPLLAIVISLFFFLEHYRFDTQRELVLAEEQKRLDFSVGLLVRDLEILVSDLVTLSSSPALQGFLNNSGSTGQDRRNLEQRFLNFSRDRTIYDQIRYLDQSGNEIVRINFNQGSPTAVDASTLQNKATRYYFKNSISLAKGKLYLSPLDLNMEHGEVEQPHKPVIRAAMPLFDAQDNLRGILIFNYLAKGMLARFKKWMPPRGDISSQLLNRDGYWLSHPDSLREWGFMLGAKEHFATNHPAEWENIKRNRNGRFKRASDSFLFKTISPNDEAVKAGGKLNGSQPEALLPLGNTASSWVVVSHIPGPPFLSHLLQQRATDLIFLLLLVLLTGIGAWRYAKAIALRGQWESLTNLLFHSIEQSPTAVIITDKSGDIEYVNEKFAELSGFESKEVVGENPRVLKSGDKSPTEYQGLWQTITAGKVWRGEFHNKKRTGDFYWAEAKISPIFNDKSVITHFIGIQEDVTEKRKLQKELEYCASHDILTGLLNRTLLEEKLTEDVNRSLRYEHPLSLFMLDLDHFKTVNDTHGHQAGDALLKNIATILQDSVRVTDYVGRYGGEEFVIVLPETSFSQAMEMSERLRSRIAGNQVKICAGTTLSVTASIGVATFPGHGNSSDKLLAAADMAMYSAKEAGRNQVKIALRECSNSEE